jgi:hypothetical protein
LGVTEVAGGRIDAVRRITNCATGELGVQLHDTLARAGLEGLCLKSSGATHRGPGEQFQLSLLEAHDHLLEVLRQTIASNEIAAVVHVAALPQSLSVLRREKEKRGGLETTPS